MQQLKRKKNMYAFNARKTVNFAIIPFTNT